MTTFYISGKISVTGNEKQEDNEELFMLAEEHLQNEGHLTHNPARFKFSDEELAGLTEMEQWSRYLSRDLAWIIEHRPSLFMLKNWKESRGAILERDMALALGLEVVYQ